MRRVTTARSGCPRTTAVVATNYAYEPTRCANIDVGPNRIHTRYTVLRECFAEGFATVVAIDPAAAVQIEADRAAALEAWGFLDACGDGLDFDNFRARVFPPLLVAAELRHVRIHDLPPFEGS